jgi:hypothetical protein
MFAISSPDGRDHSADCSRHNIFGLPKAAGMRSQASVLAPGRAADTRSRLDCRGGDTQFGIALDGKLVPVSIWTSRVHGRTTFTCVRLGLRWTFLASTCGLLSLPTVTYGASESRPERSDA